MTTTISTSAGFSIQTDAYDRETFPGLRKGPAAGDVESPGRPRKVS